MGAFPRAQWNETEKETANRRHAGHYMQVLSQANALYEQGGDGILAGLAVYDRELEHIQAGQSWAAKNNPQLANKYPNAGFLVLSLRLNPREGIAWLEAAWWLPGK